MPTLGGEKAKQVPCGGQAGPMVENPHKNLPSNIVVKKVTRDQKVSDLLFLTEWGYRKKPS